MSYLEVKTANAYLTDQSFHCSTDRIHNVDVVIEPLANSMDLGLGSTDPPMSRIWIEFSAAFRLRHVFVQTTITTEGCGVEDDGFNMFCQAWLIANPQESLKILSVGTEPYFCI
ncbi:hypothetical protein IFR05_011052 [Cadophora sp. M221]|nr:hypothetical protein IFR05_011052 [Cadophora sp. M221]